MGFTAFVRSRDVVRVSVAVVTALRCTEGGTSCVSLFLYASMLLPLELIEHVDPLFI